MILRDHLHALAVASAMILTLPAHATTLVVPDDYPTIQSALDAAAGSDTVGVRSGTYDETLVLAGKDLVVMGWFTGFPTIHDNPIVRAPANTRALRIGPGVTNATLFMEISFTGGRAEKGGGALVTAGSACMFRGCGFISNTAACATQYQSRGGALYVESGASVRIDDSGFRGNAAISGFQGGCDGLGGAIYLESNVTLVARNVLFARNTAAGFEGGWGGAVYFGGEGADASFETCDFDSNFAGYGGAIQGFGRLSVERCRFRGNQGLYGPSAIAFGYGPVYHLQENLFHDNQSLVTTVELGGAGDVISNTFAFNSSPFGSKEACLRVDLDETVVRNNIVTRNQGIGIQGMGIPLAVAISCNDVWGNGGGNYGGDLSDQTGVNGNLSADPAFCDTTNRMLGLRGVSPCASGPCGLIGALPVQCPPNAVGETPAGSIALLPARPNPMRDVATLDFVLAAEASVRLDIMDVSGRRIVTLAEGRLPAGRHAREWSLAKDPEGRPRPGVYYARLTVGATRLTRAIVVVR